MRKSVPGHGYFTTNEVYGVTRAARHVSGQTGSGPAIHYCDRTATSKTRMGDVWASSLTREARVDGSPERVLLLRRRALLSESHGLFLHYCPKTCDLI